MLKLARPHVTRGPGLGRDRSEGGYTLTELMVTTAIFMTVMSALLTTLEVATRQERRTSAIVDNQFTVLNALQTMSREIRAANPIDSAFFASSDEMRWAIAVTTYGESDTDVNRWYFYADADGSLVQEDLDDASFRRVLVPRLINTASQPLFRYYDDLNQELTTTGSGAVEPSVIEQCATRVVIHVISEADTRVGAPPPYEAMTSVDIRNRLPGGTGCHED